MIVGVPREIKVAEQRVALTPAGARAFREANHRVLVEPGAGDGSGIADADYTAAGAELAAVEDLWTQADLVLKVKEPAPHLDLRPDQRDSALRARARGEGPPPGGAGEPGPRPRRQCVGRPHRPSRRRRARGTARRGRRGVNPRPTP